MYGAVRYSLMFYQVLAWCIQHDDLGENLGSVHQKLHARLLNDLFVFPVGVGNLKRSFRLGSHFNLV